MPVVYAPQGILDWSFGSSVSGLTMGPAYSNLFHPAFSFLSFSIASYIFARLFSLPPTLRTLLLYTRDSDRGHIRSRLLSPLTTTVSILHGYREKTSALSSLVDSRQNLLAGMNTCFLFRATMVPGTRYTVAYAAPAFLGSPEIATACWCHASTRVSGPVQGGRVS